MNYIKTMIAIAAISTTIAVPSIEYNDIAGFSNKTEKGRTKNSIATVVSGIVGQKLYGNSNINLEVQKKMWPDSKITGNTTSSSIDTYTDLTFSSAKFTAKNNSLNLLEGTVDKSEFDWDIKQINDSTYHISRFGLKFDSELEIKVSNGIIEGKYIRPGPHFDWNIEGTYDNSGNIKIEIDGPMNLGIDLIGKITKN